MAATTNPFNLPLTFNQVFELVKQLPTDQKNKLIKVLQKGNAVNESIPEAHKTLVRERIKNSKANELLDWNKVQNDFDGI